MSRLVVLAYLPLLLATICSLLAFLAPFWLLYPQHQSHLLPAGGVTYHPVNGEEWAEGLWARCFQHDHRCDWFWKDDFQLQRSFKEWHYASQALFLSGILILLTAFTMQTCCVCCGCLGSRNTRCISATTGTMLLIIVAVQSASLAVYGVHVSREHQIYEANYNPSLGWSFYLGIVGTASAFVSAVIVFCDACRSRHLGYQKASIV